MINLLIVAGGTGGHIWPSIAFGQWAERNAGARVTFVCGNRPIEREIYSWAGVNPIILPLSGSPLGKMKAFVSRSADAVLSAVKAWEIIKETDADLCLLFGGYISAPFILASRVKGVKTVVHEQNAIAGRVTRLAWRTGIPVLSGWNRCKPFPPGTFTSVGIPVRKIEKLEAAKGWKKLGLSGLPFNPPRVLVMGGSLGSASLKEIAIELSRRPEFASWGFIIVGFPSTHEMLPQNVISLPRVWDISALFSLASIAIVRGGASTLAELLAYKLPAIVVPWKEAVGNHQLENGRCFVELGGGKMWTEREPIENLAAMLQEVAEMTASEARCYDVSETVCSKMWERLMSFFSSKGEDFVV